MDFLPRPADALKGDPLSGGKYNTPVKVRWDRVYKRVVNGDFLFGGFVCLWFYGLVYMIKETPDVVFVEKWLLENVDLLATVDFFREEWHYSFIIAAAYILLLVLGPKVMQFFDRPRWLKPVIVLWNLLLVIFSTAGAFRIISLTLPEVQRLGALSFICHDARNRCGNLPLQCLYLCLFCASKVPEMLDTVFLIIAKKNVIFLHWFHHLTVMLFCWVSWAYMTPVGILYAAMNFSVHSLMYAWYGLAAIRLKPTRYLSQAVTVLQIVQMVFGSILAVYVSVQPTCENHVYATRTGILIYGSYLVLFVKFFINAYYLRPKKKGKGKQKQHQEPAPAGGKKGESKKSK